MIRERIGRALGGTAIGAPLEYVLDALYGVLHPELLRDGASGEERRMPLAGDGLVPQPMWQATRAQTIAATPSEVWPWLAQMGYGRAGWYAWSPFVGAKTTQYADEIVPHLQQVAVGDVMLDGPGCNDRLGAWTVREVRPQGALVLYSLRDPITGRELDPGHRGGRYIDCSWAFVLVPWGPTTRLLVRTRLRYAPRIASAALRLVFAPGDTVMQRTMLRGIRDRVERRQSS